MPEWVAPSLQTTILLVLLLFLVGPLVVSFAQAKGKRWATHEDIKQILDELRLTTAQTEEIKARVSGGEWNRQWLLNQKRDVYRDAFETLGELIAAANLIRALRLMKETGLRFSGEELKQAYFEFNGMTRRLRTIRATAMIFLGEDARVLLDEAAQKRPYEKLQDESEWFEREVSLLETLRERLVEAGCKDLGVSQDNGRLPSHLQRPDPEGHQAGQQAGRRADGGGRQDETAPAAEKGTT